MAYVDPRGKEMEAVNCEYFGLTGIPESDFSVSHGNQVNFNLTDTEGYGDLWGLLITEWQPWHLLCSPKDQLVFFAPVGKSGDAPKAFGDLTLVFKEDEESGFETASIDLHSINMENEEVKRLLLAFSEWSKTANP